MVGLLALGLVGWLGGLLGWPYLVDAAFDGSPMVKAMWVFPALAGAGLMAGLGYVLIEGAETRAVAAQKKWLRTLPFEFDVDAYLSGLDRRYKDAHLEMTIELGVDIQAEQDRSTVVDAVHGALEVRRALCHARRLELSSPSFSTYSSGSVSSGAGPDGTGAGSSSPAVYSNRPLHLWFRKCVERLLVPLGQRYAIVAMTAKVVGSR